MLSLVDILNANILIVDDQEFNVQLLEQMLREAGYQRIASTMEPQAVCGLHRNNHYDLILLDLQMPGMDGFQVMEGLNEIETDGYVPILVITAQPGHKLRALMSGAKDFVAKPFDLVEVKTRIHNMLEVRLLYKQLDAYNQLLEQTVQERTAELRESEARYRGLTELASDWPSSTTTHRPQARRAQLPARLLRAAQARRFPACGAAKSQILAWSRRRLPASEAICAVARLRPAGARDSFHRHASREMLAL